MDAVGDLNALTCFFNFLGLIFDFLVSFLLRNYEITSRLTKLFSPFDDMG